MPNNISKFKECYGCGVCVKGCPVKIISIEENGDGFYSPKITDHAKCIDCGICLKICAFNHDEIATPSSVKLSGAMWSQDEKVRSQSSSGGVSFEIGGKLIADGYEAVGVRYNSKNRRAEHYISESVDEFIASMGSKYIPSFPLAFGQIDLKKKYLVSGTPCQIDSMRRLIRLRNVEDNFILVDFFCHGVPSLLLWDKYLSEVEGKIGEADSVKWRSKITGWHDSWIMCIDKKNYTSDSAHDTDNSINKGRKCSYQSAYSKGDLFYDFFLGNYCLNKCCYDSCKYKMLSSSADIRIGDFWRKSYATDSKGVSTVIAFTERGKNVLTGLEGRCCFKAHSVEDCCEGQMLKAPKRPFVWTKLLTQLRSRRSLREIRSGLIASYRLTFIHNRILNKLKILIKGN